MYKKRNSLVVQQIQFDFFGIVTPKIPELFTVYAQCVHSHYQQITVYAFFVLALRCNIFVYLFGLDSFSFRHRFPNIENSSKDVFLKEWVFNGEILNSSVTGYCDDML